MKKIKNLFNEICSKHNLVGAESIIIKNNCIKEKMVYGFLDKENNIPLSFNSIFRIASVSKLIVATCMMMLIEEKKADLDEDISNYLGFKIRNPKYKDDKITLKMIMTQTSSISDGHEIDNGYSKDSGYNYVIGLNEDVLLEELLCESGKYFVDECFNDSKPGTKFEYSNFGCGIMACIIERITNKYFFDFAKEKVFKPLKLNASFIASDLKDYPIISSYDNLGCLNRNKDSFVNRSITKRTLGNNYIGPAGGLFISILDLSKIMYQYMNDGGILLKKDTMDRMLQLTWYGERDFDYTAKGLQFQILDYFDNHRLYGHFGTAYGVKTYLFFNPRQKIGTIFFTNGGGFKMNDNSGISDVQEELLSLFIKKYWNNSLKSTFVFSPSNKVGYLDGRKIELEYKKENRKTVSKRPFLDEKTMLDAFNISSIEGKNKIDEMFRNKHFIECITNINNEFDYDYSVSEAYKNKNYKDTSNVRYLYFIKYKRKENIKLQMKLISNYHTHTSYCNHAEGKVCDYVKSAYDNGYKILGISDHGPIPYEFINNDAVDNEGYLNGRMNYNIMINSYLNDIEIEKQLYKNKLDIKKSVEIEYFSNHNEYYKELLKKCDYLLLGQHYALINNKLINTYFNIDYLNVIEYAKIVEEALDTKLFKIIAHPDLFMYHYISEKGILRQFDKNALIATNIIINACINNNVIMEFNALGVGRGKNNNDDGSIDYPYPRKEFWKEVRKHKTIKILIGCDAHSPKALYSNNISKTIRLTQKYKLNIINIDK